MGMPIFEPYKSEQPMKTLAVDGWILRSFPLPHDGVENRGVYITCPDGHRILYCTDMEYIPYSFKNQCMNTLLIECNYTSVDDDESKTSHVLKGHASLDVAKGIVDANKTDALRNVILCHLSESNADKDLILKEIRSLVDADVNVVIANKGLQMPLTDWRDM